VSIDWILTGQGPVFRESVFSGLLQPKVTHKFFDILTYGGKDAELLKQNIDWIYEKAGIEKKKKQAAKSNEKNGMGSKGEVQLMMSFPIPKIL